MLDVWVKEYRIEDAFAIRELYNEPGLRGSLDFQRIAVSASYSAFATTFLHENTILGCAGIAEINENTGELWFMLSSLIDDYKKTLVGYSRSVFNAWWENSGYNRFQVIIPADRVRQLRFAEWLGMEREGVMRGYGSNGEDHVILARVK